MMQAIPELDRKGLREFGLLMGGIVAGLFGLLLPWLLDLSLPRWPWIFAGVFAVWALIAPVSLNPVYRVWMMFGLMMSRIMTPLILAIVFFLVITPMGLARRLFRSDSIPKDFDADSTTYRVSTKETPPKNLERPF